MKTDDPRLTAYALDELAPAERAGIEALLADDSSLSEEVRATRELAAQWKGELHGEAAAPLSPTQRSKVLAVARTAGMGALPADARFTRTGQTVLALAAGLILIGFIAMLMSPMSLLDGSAGRLAGNEQRTGHFKSTEGLVLGTSVSVADMAAPPASEVRLRADASGAAAFQPSATITTTNMPPGAALPGSDGTPSFSVAAVSASSTSFTGEVNRIAQTTPPVLAPYAPAPAILTPQPSTALTKMTAGKTAGFTGGWAKGGAASRGGGAYANGELPAEVVAGGESFRVRREADRAGNTESYDAIADNAFLPVKDHPLSTLSIDVDTASYANVRRFLTSGALPPKGAVRIEEMLNYFPCDYPQPAGDAPFSATMEVAACPWTPEHRLVRIGLKGRDLARSERPAANLVFLLDVSGSMQPANKLPLVKESLRLLIDQLDDRDQVAIAVYAGASGTVLDPTRDKAAMRTALDRLEAGGSTNGAGGIQLAYALAAKSFIKGGTNRVILATDGDFNVGITSQSDLVELIEKKAKSGIFLSVLGYGMGNLKDSTLEKLADKGNGNYGYIDTLAEAKKTLVEQMNGTLHTIAKDVKMQVEFNPAQAAAFRLIGCENRLLAKEDFNDDKKDAGEIGAGHSVTALYEVVPAGGVVPGVPPPVDELKYSSKPASAPGAEKAEIFNPQAPISNSPSSPELLTLKLRYKMPDGDVSTKLEFPLTDRGETWEKSSPDFRWAAAVASFGMLLRDSPHNGRAKWDSTLELAHEGRGEDRAGYRAECIALIEKARTLRR